MEGRLELLVVFWKAWGVQVMVLMSFWAQIMLLFMGNFRRQKESGYLKINTWLAYVMADTTAVYALGHMSVTVRSPEHELMVLWAPLLLVHLGGQDNITAYAIEDNQLWMRHLSTFVVQVLAAAYVVYESSILGRNTWLRSATVLMFVVGILKYWERVLALMCASNCTSSSLSATDYKDFRHVLEKKPDTLSKATTSPRDKADLLLAAYMMLDVPKQMFEGPTRFVKINSASYYEGETMSQLVGLQLSMMHDLLYTKAAVVHTWYGYCIRVISLAATIAALRLFHASGDKLHGGYNRVDVVETRVLLAGALCLEIISVLRIVFSIWTSVLVFGRAWHGIYRLLQFITLPKMTAIQRRYWSGSMGQSNLFNTITGSRHNLTSKIARRIGWGDWWDSKVHSMSTLVSKDIIQILVKQVSASESVTDESPYHINNSRGRQALRSCGMLEHLEWSLELDLDESILVWHIATIFYNDWCLKNHRSDELNTGGSNVKVITENFSNYMFFLLAARPYMLPYPVSRQRYVQLCYDLVTSPKEVLSAIRREVLHPGFDPLIISSSPAELTETGNNTLSSGWRLALNLISIDMGLKGHFDTSIMIFNVWVEMLCYTSYRCNEHYHAQHLSNGGEILTSIALLMLYMSRKRSPQPETPV